MDPALDLYRAKLKHAKQIAKCRSPKCYEILRMRVTRKHTRASRTSRRVRAPGAGRSSLLRACLARVARRDARVAMRVAMRRVLARQATPLARVGRPLGSCAFTSTILIRYAITHMP